MYNFSALDVFGCKAFQNHGFGITSRKELIACGTHKLSLAVSVIARQ
jgi:hypothetical protein